jgi:osmotically-inducible protein OsmY
VLPAGATVSSGRHVSAPSGSFVPFDDKERIVSRRSLELAVRRALADYPRIRAHGRAVDAIDADVILRGTVGSLLRRTEAVRCVRRLPAVRSVDDRLKVRLTGPQAEANADTKAAVLDALIAAPAVHAGVVDVQARGGTVRLRGMVEQVRQRDEAEQIARQVPGVTEVRNELEVRLTVSADDVAERITDAIGADAQVGVDHVTATVDDSDVTLTGWVTSPEHRAAAPAAASGAPGVAEAHDELGVQARGA